MGSGEFPDIPYKEDDMKKSVLRASALVFAALFVLFSFASCSSGRTKSYDSVSKGDYYNYSEEAVYSKADMAYEDYDYGYEMTEAEPSSSPKNVSDTRKIIRTMSLSAETLDFDTSVNEIQSAVMGFGGYIESSNISGNNLLSSGGHRHASFTLRIPAAKLDEFVSALGNGINIVTRYENSRDITDEYYDAAARLKSLETQEERLLSMLEGATELQYMLELEDHLASVRYQIESYYSTLQRYDSQVSMSTLSIDLDEVIKYQPPVTVPVTFGERISSAFRNSWEDFVEGCQDFSVDFVYAVPTLIVWAIIIFVIVMIIRAVVKKRKAKKALAAYQNAPVSDKTNTTNTQK